MRTPFFPGSPFAVLAVVFSLLLLAPAHAGSPEDLLQHPLYSTYQFGKDAKIVDFGVQPLSTSIGVIADVMQRDRILRDQLASMGWEIRFHRFFKGPDINFFLARKEIDVAMLGNMPSIKIAADGEGVIPALAQKGFVGVVSPSPLRLSQLKGRRIGFAPDSDSQYGLLVTLETAGLTESDIIGVPMDVNAMVDSLEAGKIDLFSAWDPIPAICQTRLPKCTVIQKVLTPCYLVVSTPFFRTEGPAASFVMASFLRAILWLQQSGSNLARAAAWNLQSVDQLLGKPSGISITEVINITEDEILKIAMNPAVPESDLDLGGGIHRTFRFLQAQKRIRHDIPWEKILEQFDRKAFLQILDRPDEYRVSEFSYDE